LRKKEIKIRIGQRECKRGKKVKREERNFKMSFAKEKKEKGVSQKKNIKGK
jgi:hypothetical protein